ncbi:hypothetical protein DRP77_06650 [Candidatus Poribacteria bacterium]|nr:MAG: hypothetical protein DRP77_06650 [Candidatus Poribacteria bacterium]
MHGGLKFLVLLVLFLLAAPHIEGRTLFETDFNEGFDESKWVVLGNPKIEVVEDKTAPRHGPKVLIVDNDASIMGIYVRDLVFEDGIIEILWRDVDVAGNPDRDADGPLFARADIEQSVQKRMWVGYVMELDADSGFHVNVGDGVQAPVLAIRPDLRTTGEWNWIKWRLEGELLQLKTWDADEPEPEEWMLEARDNTYSSGEVGIQVWSGKIHVAFFRVTDLEGPHPVGLKGMLPILWSELKER